MRPRIMVRWSDEGDKVFLTMSSGEVFEVTDEVTSTDEDADIRAKLTRWLAQKGEAYARAATSSRWDIEAG